MSDKIQQFTQRIGWKREPGDGIDNIISDAEASETNLTVTIDVSLDLILVTAGGSGDLRDNFHVSGWVTVVDTDDNDGTYQISAVAADSLTVIGLVGTDVIGDVSVDLNVVGESTFYEFGIYTTSWGKFPVLESELKQYFKGLQFNAYQQKVASTRVNVPISFIPVNGLMFKFVMAKEGSGVVHAGGVFRIDGILFGFLDTYVIRYRSDNDQDRIQRSCVGSKFLSLNYSLDFDNPNDPMAAQLVALSRRMDAIQSSSSAANPTQPANSNQFFIDDNTKVLWDVDLTANGQYVNTGTDLDLVPYLISLTQSIDVQTKPAKILTVHHLSYLTNGNRIFSFNMRLRRTDETSVFDHYVGTTVDGTVGNDDSQAGKSYAGTAAFKNMHFKIFAKDSNGDVVNYIQMDYKDVGIVRIEMNNVDPEGDEEAWYDITCIATSGVPTTKDEVPAALYGTS